MYLTITGPTSANKMMATKGNKGYKKLRPWRLRSHVRLSIVFPWWEIRKLKKKKKSSSLVVVKERVSGDGEGSATCW